MQSTSTGGGVSAEQYLPARRVLARYGISDMSLHRWLRDPKLAFPTPVYINTRRYWALRDLVKWERARSGKSPGEIELAVEQRAIAGSTEEAQS
jgi:predicted DNA-binding transcriptional regulator AlpA